MSATRGSKNVHEIIVDPIPNQFILFLKYLCNKKVINCDNGNFTMNPGVWESNFNYFRLARKFSFDNLSVSLKSSFYL